MTKDFTRRSFIAQAAAIGGALGVCPLGAGEPVNSAPQPLKPIGQAKGLHPGRVVWVHDPQVTDWKGPGHGHWYEASHTSQDRKSTRLNSSHLKLSRMPSSA